MTFLHVTRQTVPRIHMTGPAKFALCFLPIYLAAMLVLILVKFLRIFG